MEYDNKHHEIAERLFSQYGWNSIEATREEDIKSIADRWLIDQGTKIEPVALKHRGVKGGNDCNVTAWSYANGLLPEYALAGNKLFLYHSNRGESKLVRMPSQEILDAFLPKRWIYPAEGGWVEGSRGIAWVRPNSRASNVPQGVIYVPEYLVTVLVRWDIGEKVIEEHPDLSLAEV